MMAAVYSQMLHKKYIRMQRGTSIQTHIHEERMIKKCGKMLHLDNIGEGYTEILCTVFATFL